MTHDEKMVEAASRAYCKVIGLAYDDLSPVLAAKRDEAMRAAITAYQAEAWQPRSTDAVDALASSWASIDGKLDAYEQERGMSLKEAYRANLTGHYAGYQVEAVEMIQRLRKRGFDVVPLPNPPASP